MEKTAVAFFYPAMKSVPVNSKPRTAKQIRDYMRKALILRSYTLCEVPEESRQVLPTAKTPLFVPEKVPDTALRPQ